MRTSQLAAAGLVLVALLSGCSDDDGYGGSGETPSPGATEQVCDAVSEVRGTLDAVRQDVSEGNLGDARDSLQDLGNGLDDLREAVQDLGEERRAEIQPDIDAAEDAVGSLREASGLNDVTAALGSIRSSVESALTKAGDDAECS